MSDAETGQGLELVSIVAEAADGRQLGATTDLDGRYQIAGVVPGRYILRASYLGYRAYTDTIDVAADEVRTISIRLEPETMDLDEVVVQSERSSGAARVTAGQQTIRPEDIELIPTPDLAGDLAGYLSTLPGVVSTGDRGGQMFIRGGEASQNLVQLDGIPVFQPFHLVGFYSAFPSDIISRADVYAGGFGARFGERLSSVIDVWTREGNKRRFTGAVSLSPFIGTALLEGPIIPGRVSFLASVRESMVERLGEQVAGREMPFSFGDAFGKVHADLSSTSRISASFVRSRDRGTLQEDVGLTGPEEVRWNNRGFGIRHVALPKQLPVATELSFTRAHLDSELGTPDDPDRSTSVDDTHLSLHATFFGPRTNVDAGFSARFIDTRASLEGAFQNADLSGTNATSVALYVEPEYKTGALRIRPGARLQFSSMHFDPHLEPRLRAVLSLGAHEFSAATGIYHQELVGITDQGDAASVFTAWSNVYRVLSKRSGDDEPKVPRAIHGLLGYRVNATSWLELSAEAFYKDLKNLYVAEWTPYPQMTTNLQPAEGRALGMDFRVELRGNVFQAFATYGLSSTRYTARQSALPLWFNTDALTYRPAHDRRHQINVVGNTRLAGFDMSVRWEFGSGLPFSRPEGFDGFVPIDDVPIRPDKERWRRAIYGMPFNAELPTYHRLDATIERAFSLKFVKLTVLGSVINGYDRRNIFYADVFTLERVDQLRLLPSVGLKIEVR